MDEEATLRQELHDFLTNRIDDMDDVQEIEEYCDYIAEEMIKKLKPQKSELSSPVVSEREVTTDAEKSSKEIELIKIALNFHNWITTQPEFLDLYPRWRKQYKPQTSELPIDLLICQCGHDINFHNALSNNSCHEIDCKCKGFKTKSNSKIIFKKGNNIVCHL